MAIAIGNTTTGVPAAGTTVTITMPTCAVGDLLLVYINSPSTSDAEGDFTTPTGWTLVGEQHCSGFAHTSFLYARTAVSGDSADDIDWVSSTSWAYSWLAVAVTDTDSDPTTLEFTVAVKTNWSASLTSPSIITVEDDLILRFVAGVVGATYVAASAPTFYPDGLQMGHSWRDLIEDTGANSNSTYGNGISLWSDRGQQSMPVRTPPRAAALKELVDSTSWPTSASTAGVGFTVGLSQASGGV